MRGASSGKDGAGEKWKREEMGIKQVERVQLTKKRERESSKKSGSTPAAAAAWKRLPSVADVMAR